MAKEKPRKAWLAPLTVPLALRERLEHEWSRMNTAMGITLPKSHFVRMLLERGLDEVGQAVWAGSEGVTVRPSTPCGPGLLTPLCEPSAGEPLTRTSPSALPDASARRTRQSRPPQERAAVIREREAIVLFAIAHREWAREPGRMTSSEAVAIEGALNAVIRFCEERDP
jgi:hypothetical protein